MSAVALQEVGLPVGGGMGVENSHIKVYVRSKRPPHSPFAATSNQAPSVVIPGRCSLDIGCKCGWVQTLLQTSDKRLAVKSLISLCRNDGTGNPQEKTCSTENLVPHSQLMGTRDGSQPYRRIAMATPRNKRIASS